MAAHENVSPSQFAEHLLSFGGDRVIGHEGDPDLTNIMTRGKTFSGKDPIMMPGAPSRCHGNVCALHDANPHVKVHTGFALSDDGTWRPHSWATSGKNVVETTTPRSKYLGFRMNNQELDEFKFNNG